MKKASPYGKTVTLKDSATGVECWNFIDRSEHTLPAGTMLKLEHVHEKDSTVCMLVDEAGTHPGIMLTRNDGVEQRGYRFILKNEQLNSLADAGLPKKTYDIVGSMMAYEDGKLNKRETIRLFKHLKKGNLIDSLQGSYGRAARRLEVA